MASISDLLKTYSLEELDKVATVVPKGMDTANGKRDVELNNPLLYTTVEVEPAPIPEGAQLETRGTGLNERDVLIGESVDNNAFTRLLGGLADFATFGISDFDKRGNLFGGEHGATGYGREWDQEKENRLKKQQRINDLTTGKALPTRDEALEIIKGMSIFDEYSDERTIRKEQDALKRFIGIYPELEGVVNDAVLKRTLQKRYLDPADVQERMQSARDNYIGALEGRAKAQKDIAIATAMGLGRYSGIRNVAG
tara:strand:- start:24 stop:785 length:762 start_codon:yes stop_codon:yes gene_type:complete